MWAQQKHTAPLLLQLFHKPLLSKQILLCEPNSKAGQTPDVVAVRRSGQNDKNVPSSKMISNRTGSTPCLFTRFSYSYLWKQIAGDLSFRFSLLWFDTNFLRRFTVRGVRMKNWDLCLKDFDFYLIDALSEELYPTFLSLLRGDSPSLRDGFVINLLAICSAWQVILSWSISNIREIGGLIFVLCLILMTADCWLAGTEN